MIHEAMPGHHLQIALARGRLDLPAFRRHDEPTAFIADRLLCAERPGANGRLSSKMWRTCRRIMGVGLRRKGWSQDPAMRCLPGKAKPTVTLPGPHSAGLQDRRPAHRGGAAPHRNRAGAPIRPARLSRCGAGRRADTPVDSAGPHPTAASADNRRPPPPGNGIGHANGDAIAFPRPITGAFRLLPAPAAAAPCTFPSAPPRYEKGDVPGRRPFANPSEAGAARLRIRSRPSDR